MLKERVWFYFTSSYIKRSLLYAFLISCTSFIFSNPIVIEVDRYNPDFTNEVITISITEDNQVKIKGIYHFSIEKGYQGTNSYHELDTNIAYPFPKSYGEVEIDKIFMNSRKIYDIETIVDTVRAKKLLKQAGSYNLDFFKQDNTNLLKLKHLGYSPFVAYYRYNYDYPNENYNTIPLILDFALSDKCSLEIQYLHHTQNKSCKYILKSTESWDKPIEKSVIEVIVPKGYRLESNYKQLKYSKTMKDGKRLYKMVKTNFSPTKDLIFEWHKK